MAPRSMSARLSIFCFFHGSAKEAAVGDEVRLAFHHRVDDAQAIGAQRAAGLGDFNDGVGEHGRLDFGGAPAELDLDRDVFAGEVLLGDFDQLGGDDFAG